MKLTKKALGAIDNRQFMLKLAADMNCGFTTVYKWIKDNSDNLTKAAALRVIREETGLTESEILEESEAIDDAKPKPYIAGGYDPREKFKKSKP